MPRKSRIFAAATVALACLVFLDPMTPALDPDHGNYDVFAFWLKFDGAVRYFFAITVAAVIARRGIAIPAAVIAIAIWGWTVSVLYKIAAPLGTVRLNQLMLTNIDGLVMMVAAGVIGALLGGWFYRRELKDARAAA